MPKLRDLLIEVKLGNPRTFLQSGNVVFTSTSANTSSLERKLEIATEKRFGFCPTYTLRGQRELDSAIAGNPFPKEARSDPSHLVMLFPKTAVSAKTVTRLRTAIRGREVVAGEGRALYLYFPDGIGPSKLTPAIVEKTLGTPATMRNWNTVTKLSALAANG